MHYVASKGGVLWLTRDAAICLGQRATTSKIAEGLDLRSITAEGCSWNGL